MLKNRSNLLAVFTILMLLLLPISYYIVSFQIERQNDDEALLKRLMFAGGAIQRVLKQPDDAESQIADIEDAFASAETRYPSLSHPAPFEHTLAADYVDFKSCWQSAKEQLPSGPDALSQQAELCWLKGNKTVFDLYNVMQHKRKKMLNDLYMLGAFGTLLLLFLLYQIYRYVHGDLEKNRMIDARTGFYNASAFLSEATASAVLAKRLRNAFATVLIKFSEECTDTKSVKSIAEQLQKSCRQEEKLFLLGTGSFALMTAHTEAFNPEPLRSRLQADLSGFPCRFVIEVLSFSPADDEADAFGPACLQRLERLTL